MSQRIVITGASAGVGAAVARRFADRSARLLLAARGQPGLDAIAAELSSRTEVVTMAMDVANDAQCEALIARAEDVFGGIDVLVNNAGYNARGDFEAMTAMDLAQMVDVNLRAPVVLTRHALPVLRRQGGGAIVNVASLAGRTPVPHAVVYSASKFGLRAFSLALNEELRGSGITVSVVSPGPIDTGFLLDDIDQVPDLVLSQPMSSAEQVADAVVDCALRGTPERALPAASAILTHFAYLVPAAARKLKPLLEARGRRAKAVWRKRWAERQR
ncbi:MAG: SDR family oxidoreductase [Polyangiaceae bacterium]